MRRFLVIVGMVVLGMTLLGWLSFSQTGERATISIETKEIKEDTGKAMEKGKELTEEAGRKTRSLLNESRDHKPPADQSPRRSP